jgi:hypothetical protein
MEKPSIQNELPAIPCQLRQLLHLLSCALPASHIKQIKRIPSDLDREHQD